MTKNARADQRPSIPTDKRTALRRALLGWFRKHARDLPWRRTRNPYRIWLSEIMLQQTRVETVEPYYRRFLETFPTVGTLADAKPDRVLKLWEGLGYYTRARNLHRTAKVVTTEHAGRFPRTAKALQQLPGVGRYTAGAIASIAFSEAAPILDGNVKRVLARIFDIQACIDETDTVNRLWDLATELVPKKDPGDFNQSMMELGARICTPRSPDCTACPIRAHCAAHASGRQEKLPIRRKRKPIPHYQIVVAAIRRNGRYLIGKRPPDGLLGGLWEFPGGKVERGESRPAALRREVAEECGIAIAVGRKIASVDHAYTHFKITLHAYACEPAGGRIRAKYHDALKWVPPSQFDRYAFPAANHKFLSRLH